MKQKPDIYISQLKILEDAMDKQQNFRNELFAYVDKHGAEKLPPEYAATWLAARLQGRKNWRDRKTVVRRIKKAARKAAKNSTGSKIQ